IAVVTNTSSPQTIGLDRPRPGIGVFQRTFVPFDGFHVVGSEKPSAMPLASMPRNCGQSTAGFGAAGAPTSAMVSVRTAELVVRMRTMRGCYTLRFSDVVRIPGAGMTSGRSSLEEDRLLASGARKE